MTCTPDCVAPSRTQAHCGGDGCHITWSGVTGFDRHRRAGRCLTPDEIGYHSDGSGVYRAPITDAARTSLAALGRRRRDAPSARLSEPQSDRNPVLVVADATGLPEPVRTRSGERTVHATHLPEVNGRSFPGCRYCMCCCRLMWSERFGVTDRGTQPCPGSVRIGFRVPR